MLKKKTILILMICIIVTSESLQSESESEVEEPKSQVPITKLPAKILKRSKRVVGGYPTSIERLPYMVNIRRDGVFECGGSLITPNCVLTAAHCIKTGRAENFTIRGGNTFLDDKRNSRRVKQIYMHELYDNKTLNHDVAIFELQTPLPATNTNGRDGRDNRAFSVIRIASKWSEMPQTGDAVRVAGWGLISEEAKRPSNQLRSVQVDVMSQTECQQLYQNYRNVTTNMFCASVPGRKDACSADSGGPAVFNGRLVGIVSWGKGYECARASSPGVYVNVAAVSGWIETVMRRSGCRH